MNDTATIAVTDRRLAEGVLHSGDERAFRALYRRHTPRLYQLVLRLVGGAEDDAEDIVQDTWLEVCEHLDTFRWESGFSTWLCAVGLNVAKSFLRHRGRDRTLHDERGHLPETATQPPIERIDLERAIALLPQGYRQIVVLHDVEGMTHREIAEHLEITEGTSKSQLSGARRLLRHYLAPHREDTNA